MSKSYHLKSAYSDSSTDSIDVLIHYLKSIGGKPLTKACRRQNAFRTSWNTGDVKLITRCHVQNAADYLNFIKASCTSEQIKVTIADLAKFVKYLEPNEDENFIVLNTNTLSSAVHFDTANKLFYYHQIRPQNQNNYLTDILALYSLRLSLESRVRGLLGIDYATCKGSNIGLSTLIKVSKGLQSVEYSKGINWDEIEWVNNWLNHHMHRHIRPYPWVVHQAIETLQPFIDPKEPILKHGKTIHSFYSATYVIDENEMEKEIESTLRKEFSEVKIQWLSHREIVRKQ